MKSIRLRDGVFALVDDEDYESLNCYRWYLHTGPRKQYAIRIFKDETGKERRVMMHRHILNHNLRHTDHIDGNGLNNQRSNIRPATISQNLANRGKPQNNTSGYKGVSWVRKIRKWTAQIGNRTEVNRTNVLGYFSDKLEAALAYDKAAIAIFGEFAYTNFPVSKPPTKETTE